MNSLYQKQGFMDVPRMVTILTYLLLHITAASCYGAMSIDLGSEFMKVGLVAPNVQMDIVLNAQSQRKTAMAIAFSNSERFVGDTALDIASKFPEKTYTHFLDLVGKAIDSEAVQNYKQRFPYINITSHEPNSTSIQLNHPDGLSLTPLELIAMMIQHAHEQVVNRLNSNEPASDVVITVPPFFNSRERRVIEDAAKLAGLNVLRLTSVNSAFALSYGIFRHKDYEPETSPNKTSILFIDQGASHTSATVADYHLVEQYDLATGQSKNESIPTVSIRAQVFDRFLGGFDMQLRLRDHLINSFANNTKIDRARIYNRGRSWYKVLKESGRVKKILSANLDHTVRVENVIDDKDLRQPITRQEFEEMNQDLMGQRIIQLLDRLLQSLEGIANFESVIIVGGNTRTPKIQQVLLDYFKLDNLGKSINADEGAALAALYQAASLGRGFRVKRFDLLEFGEKRKQFTPLPIESTIAPNSTAGDNSTVTTESTTTITSVTPDPDAIYSQSELIRITQRLAHMSSQDYLRLQRLSLRNSIESSLSQAREMLSEGEIHKHLINKRDEIEKLIAETDAWLEDGPQSEKDDVEILTNKFNFIQALLRPPPPPPPPPSSPPFDPATVDLSSILNNGTLSILEALNPFKQSNSSEVPTSTEKPSIDVTGSQSNDSSSSDSETKRTPPFTEL